MTVPQASTPGDACLYVGASFTPDCTATNGLRLPALRRVVARAQRVAVPVNDAVSFVCWAAGLDEQTLPVAAVCRFADTGETDELCWLRAEPVHMQPAQDSLRLLPAQPPRNSEAAVLATVDEYLAQDGWRLQVTGPRDWYLAAPGALECVTTPPERVVGRDVFDFMPGGEDGRRLRSLINDVQMLFHADGAAGESSVNSIWPWGQGTWEQVPAAPGKAVGAAVSSHSLVRGLWRHWNQPCHAPAAADGVLEAGGSALFMPELPAGNTGFEVLEQAWLEPMLSGLSAGRWRTLTLVAANGVALRMTRRDLRRFWRRPASLDAAVMALHPGASS
ncbi:MAG: hypothetical protein AAFN78_16155 [Pseudomonadota bacterium]